MYEIPLEAAVAIGIKLKYMIIQNILIKFKAWLGLIDRDLPLTG